MLLHQSFFSFQFITDCFSATFHVNSYVFVAGKTETEFYLFKVARESGGPGLGPEFLAFVQFDLSLTEFICSNENKSDSCCYCN